MGTGVRFYETLAKILEQKHKVKIELNFTEKGEKGETNKQ